MTHAALRWGIVGVGRSAEEHLLPAIAKDGHSQIVAVVSRTPSRADALAAKWGASQGTTSLEALLANSGIDAILIATPNCFHSHMTRLVVAAGRHVLCEKPLAMDVGGAKGALQAASEAGVVLGTVFQSRYHPVFRQVRDRVAAGAIGSLQLLEVHATSGVKIRDGWRAQPQLAGLGVLFDVGVHALDLVGYVSGEEIVEVACHMDARGTGVLDTDWVVLGRLENGARILIGISETVTEYPNEMSLYGSQGNVRFTAGARLWSVSRITVWDAVAGRSEEAVQFDVDCYGSLVSDFRRCTQTGQQPISSGQDGLRSAILVEKIVESARGGGVVVEVPRSSPRASHSQGRSGLGV